MSQVARRGAGSLHGGLDVLEVLSARGSVKLGELPELLGTSRATAFRLLATLQDRGYVEHDRRSHTYGLGAAALSLGSTSKVAVLARAAERNLQKLRDSTGETANLAVLQGGRLIYLRILDGPSPLRMSGVEGEEAPIHATALGKALLALVPDDEHAALVGPEPFARFTGKTVTSMAELNREVRDVRRRGYSIDDEGVDIGAVCLGAPIAGNHEPLGGISISGPVPRMGGSKHDLYGRALVRAAREISERVAKLPTP